MEFGIYESQIYNQLNSYIMLNQKHEAVYKDVRFWLVFILLGALLSFLILTYPN